MYSTVTHAKKVKKKRKEENIKHWLTIVMITFSTLCPLWCFFFVVIFALSCAHMCFRVVLKRNECNRRSTSRETIRMLPTYNYTTVQLPQKKRLKMRQSTRSGEARTFFQCLSPVAPPPHPPLFRTTFTKHHFDRTHIPQTGSTTIHNTLCSKKLAWEMCVRGTISFESLPKRSGSWFMFCFDKVKKAVTDYGGTLLFICV